MDVGPCEAYGVVKGSYDEVQLPKIRAFNVMYARKGHPKDSFELKSEAIPQSLEWGQVLINIRAAPINPADMFPTGKEEGRGVHHYYYYYCFTRQEDVHE